MFCVFTKNMNPYIILSDDTYFGYDFEDIDANNKIQLYGTFGELGTDFRIYSTHDIIDIIEFYKLGTELIGFDFYKNEECLLIEQFNKIVSVGQDIFKDKGAYPFDFEIKQYQMCCNDFGYEIGYSTTLGNEYGLVYESFVLFMYICRLGNPYFHWKFDDPHFSANLDKELNK